MKPWCDRPHCVRSFQHEHPTEAPDTTSGASLAVQERDKVVDPPGNGTGPHNGSAAEVGKAMVERARKARNASTPPKSEDDGGAAPEVEADVATEASPWATKWEAISGELDTLEGRARELQERRRELLTEMRKTMSLGAISAVTGISRQRVDQLLRR